MSERRTYQPIFVPGSVQHLSTEFADCKRADLHLHTRWSDGSISPEEMVDAALIAGMNAIAITDHDISASSDIALKYSRRNNFPIEVIRGVEVSSRDGHVLALNTEEHIRPHLPLVETIREIHQKKGFAIIAHPNVMRISSVPLGLVSEIIRSVDPEIYLDGIEIYNASAAQMQRVDKFGILFKDGSSNIRKFLERNIHNPKLGAILGNSDSHTRQVGYGITVYSCNSVLDAIKNRATLAMSAKTTIREDLFESIKMTYSIVRSHITGKV